MKSRHFSCALSTLMLIQQIFLLLFRTSSSGGSLSFYRIILQLKLRTKMNRLSHQNSSRSAYNPLVDRAVSELQSSYDRYSFEYSLSALDQQLYNTHAHQNYRNQSFSDIYQQSPTLSSKLEIPKHCSLTDSMLRSTLGCEEKLAKSYLQIIEQTEQKQSQEKKKRIEIARKKFAETNSHRDFCANTKPFMNNINFAIQRPVVDNEHDNYLKTQLIFLEQPRGPSLNSKEYFDKHTDIIAKKINELGGMQDTIGRMEDSLSKNQVKSFKKKQILAQMNQNKKYLFSPDKTLQRAESGKLRDSWINRSKEMRQSFMSKLQIE